MPGRLLERETELAQLRKLIKAARGGDGQLALVEGAAGIGKTRLLEEAAKIARAAGSEVLRARGVEPEQEFAFGVVRQLFERTLATQSPAQRRELLRGAAAPSAPLLGFAEAGPARPAADATFATLHGLYWLSFNLAARRPLMIAIDDAHWSDAASLRFVGFLAARLEGLPALVLLALRPDDPRAAGEMLATIRAEAGMHLMSPSELTEAACRQLVGDAFNVSADPAFSRACLEVSGGNPFYLRALVDGLLADGVSPSAENAGRVAAQVPATVLRALVLRLARLPSPTVQLARALAVLGADAELREAAALAGLDQAEAAAGADQLVGAGILAPGRPLRFMHPIIQAAVHAEVPAGDRALLHFQAARLLRETGAVPERVASHVLACEPRADAWSVKVLRSAAAEAAARGAPESAVRYLQRALLERPDPEVEARVLHELGRAEQLAGEPVAIEHLREALARTRAPRERGLIARDLAIALVFGDSWADAVAVLERAIEDIGDAEPVLAQELEAQLLAAGALHLSTRGVQLEHLTRVQRRKLGDTPAERMLLANVALWTGSAGEHASVVHDLAERALAGGRLIDDVTADSQIAHCAIDALLWSGWIERACYWLDRCIADARARGSLIGFLQAVALRGEAYYRLGRLEDAEADARAALEPELPPRWVLAPVAAGALVRVLIERGRLTEAEDALAEYDVPFGPGHPGMANWFGFAKARFALASGDARAAADYYLTIGEWMTGWGERDPELLDWRNGAARALAQVGDLERARALNDEAIALARRFERHRALGVGLRVAAALAAREERVPRLREAIEVLRLTPARLELARTLVEVGAELRRQNHRREAREPLREGTELARRCGGSALVEQGQAELIAAGARPRRVALSGTEALTPSERRVAHLAAEGLSTPDIAQQLFVTVNTVESHLRHVYAKLAIHSRYELRAAMSVADEVTAAAGRAAAPAQAHPTAPLGA
jgi:DNA-binding CsgD family transcriptional regulator